MARKHTKHKTIMAVSLDHAVVDRIDQVAPKNKRSTWVQAAILAALPDEVVEPDPNQLTLPNVEGGDQ